MRKQPSKRETERAKRAAAPPRSKPGDRRRLTSAANLPRMGGWNRWTPTRYIIEVPDQASRRQTEEEAWTEARTRVADLMELGMRQADIGRLMQPPMDRATLRKHFRDVITLGHLRQNARVAAVAFEMAISGDHPAMTRFWLRTRAGWRSSGA